MESATTEFQLFEKYGSELIDFSKLPEEVKHGAPHNLECIIEEIEENAILEDENSGNDYFEYIDSISVHFEFYLPKKKESRIKIGYADLDISHSNKIIRWEQYYPMQYLKNSEKKGLGIMAQLQALSILSDIYGDRISDYMINEGDVVSGQRKNHLTRIGISSFKTIARLQRWLFDVECFETFDSYYRKSQAYFKRKSGMEFKYLPKQQDPLSFKGRADINMVQTKQAYNLI